MVNQIIDALSSIISQDKIFVATCPLENVSEEHITLIEGLSEYVDEADNLPITEARYFDCNIYLHGNYQNRIATAVRCLSNFIIAERSYVEYINETSLHHYSILIYKKEVI